jgi:hypothetical protein
MPIDFSDYTGLISAGVIAVLQAHVRFGDGTENVLKKTKAGDAEMLDLELTLLDTEYAKSKIFWSVLVKGSTDGQKSMAETNLARLKQVIDSARFLDPNDRSAETRAKRTFNWRDFDGLRFLAEIGIEAGKDGYLDKNVVGKIITRDHPQWGGRPPIDQVASNYGPVPAATAAPQAAPQAAPPIQRPAWASETHDDA